MNIPSPFVVIPTPNNDERAFVTYHDAEQSKLSWTTDSGDNGWPLHEETLYKNWHLRIPNRVSPDDSKLWGNYVFWKQIQGQGGAIGFVWCKFKSEEEKNTDPYQIWFEQGNHYWHGILHKVSFFKDTGFPVSTNGSNGGVIVAARLYDRIIYTPPVSEGTLFEHRLYLSPSKFKIVQGQVPIPTAVQWSYHDSQGSFPECLHGPLNFPPLRSAYASYTTGGGTENAFGAANGQFFPETNFQDWSSYTLSDKQEEGQTGWERHQIIVHPPDQPEVARQ